MSVHASKRTLSPCAPSHSHARPSFIYHENCQTKAAAASQECNKSTLSTKQHNKQSVRSKKLRALVEEPAAALIAAALLRGGALQASERGYSGLGAVSASPAAAEGLGYPAEGVLSECGGGGGVGS